MSEVTLWLITGVNIGLTIANVVIALFNLRVYRGRMRDHRHQHEGRE